MSAPIETTLERIARLEALLAERTKALEEARSLLTRAVHNMSLRSQPIVADIRVFLADTAGGFFHEKCRTTHYVGHCPLSDESPRIHTASGPQEQSE